MSAERKKELVCTILSEVQDQDDWNINEEIKIQADFTTGPTNGNKRTIGKFDFKDILIYVS